MFCQITEARSLRQILGDGVLETMEVQIPTSKSVLSRVEMW